MFLSECLEHVVLSMDAITVINTSKHLSDVVPYFSFPTCGNIISVKVKTEILIESWTSLV